VYCVHKVEKKLKGQRCRNRTDRYRPEERVEMETVAQTESDR
jgi:hypothetical protein